MDLAVIARCAPFAAVTLLSACRSVALPERFPAGDAIVVCGERIPVDAPVVLWTMEPHYDGHAETPRFSSEGERGKRYAPGRRARTPALAAAVERDGWTRAHLAEQVDLFVLHYDACGTSRACFRVLHDLRQLSVHFLLDLDGTIYQTLDLREQAWHARDMNPRAIGIEIAHIGAYPPDERGPLERWYPWREAGAAIALPAGAGDGGLRRPDASLRPARAELLSGTIHGQRFVQYDFTAEQYESLAALTAALGRAFPRITLDAPRDARGEVRRDALDEEEKAAYHGVVGHYHLQSDKRDPGPAMDWERLLEGARGAAVSRGP